MKINGPGESSLLLLKVIKLLDKLRIPYAVVGAFAASYYGLVRASLDADAIISVTGHEEKLVQLSASLKKAQERAHEAYDQYSKGSSVDTLLKQYDQVESGDLGLVSEDDLLGSFKTALSRLRLKELSPPFETEAGIHLIELLEVKIEGTKSLEQAKDEIRNLLYERDFKKVLAQWIKTKKEQALIKIIPPMTKSL